MKKSVAILWSTMILCGTLFSAEYQLKVESSQRIKTPDGRTILLENLGLPLTAKPAGVEFVTTSPDGEKIAWGVFRGTIKHYVAGYGEKTGLRLIDLTKYYAPHSYKPTIAPAGGFIYILAGNRGPTLLKYEIATGKITELHRFRDRLYWLGHTVDSKGRIFWGVNNATKRGDMLIGVDPATDKIYETGKISDNPALTYALSPAADAQDIIYIPVGLKEPELWMMDLKDLKTKRSILTPEQEAALKKAKIKMPSVTLHEGKVYTRIGGKNYLCTPAGLKPAFNIRPGGGKRKNAKFPSVLFRSDGTTASYFTREGEGLVLKKPDGSTEWIKIKGLPVVGHELYAIGSVHNGKLFGSGIFGSDIFSVDLKTLKATDYGRICRASIQQYDLASTPYGVLICGYTGGFFDLFDPDKPIVKGKNPRPIGDLRAYDQERPIRLTAANADNTLFYTGSMSTKNALPGALTMIDLKNNQFVCWKNIIHNQSIMDVVTVPGSNLLFGTSSISGGTGSVPTEKEAVIFLFDPATGKVVWKDNPVKAPVQAYQGSMNTADGRILVIVRVKGSDYRWLLFDPATRTCTRPRPLPGNRSGWIFSEKRPVNGKNYFTTKGRFYEFDPVSNKMTELFSSPYLSPTGYIKYAEEDGYIYFLHECYLLRWKFVQ